MNVSLRSGLHYGFLNCGTSTDEIPYSSLPSATSERMDFAYISAHNPKTEGITNCLINLRPETTILTEYVAGLFNENSKTPPDNTIISKEHTEFLNNEIKITTIDTYPVGCVIIECDEKSAYLCYGNSSGLNMLIDTYGTPNILVLTDDIPDSIPQNIETLIISSDSDVILNENIPSLKKQCKNFYTTAKDGDIKLIL